MSDNYADSLVRVEVYYADWPNMSREERAEAMMDGTMTGEENYMYVDSFTFREDQDPKEHLWEEYNIGGRGGRRNLRSMSMGDVLVVGGEAFVCVRVGWEPVEFDEDAVTKRHDDEAGESVAA